MGNIFAVVGDTGGMKMMFLSKWEHRFERWRVSLEGPCASPFAQRFSTCFLEQFVLSDVIQFEFQMGGILEALFKHLLIACGM